MKSSNNIDEPLGLVASIVLDVASRTSLSVLTCPVSYIILSFLFPVALLVACNRNWNDWSNNVSRVEERIGENVSSGNLPLYPDTPLAPLMAADRAVAIVTLPNGANPAGWTAFFNSFMYVDNDAPTRTS